MGGRALAHLGVSRIDRETYDALKVSVCRILEDHYELVAATNEPRGKESFGDLDVIVAGARGSVPAHDDLRFASCGFVQSGPILSFEHRGHQIDLIHVDAGAFRLAQIYFTCDFGLMMGMVASSVGLKLGHEQLAVRVSSKGGNRVFTLSRDGDAIVTFFGLPPFPDEGFEQLSDMIEYIASGRFDVSGIAGVHRKSDIRARIRNRPIFAEFLKWIDDRPSSGIHVSRETVARDAAAFFGVSEAYAEFCKSIALDEHRRTVVKADIVSSVTGLSGRELGEVMRDLKSRVTMDTTEQDVAEWLEKM